MFLTVFHNQWILDFLELGAMLSYQVVLTIYLAFWWDLPWSAPHQSLEPWVGVDSLDFFFRGHVHLPLEGVRVYIGYLFRTTILIDDVNTLPMTCSSAKTVLTSICLPFCFEPVLSSFFSTFLGFAAPRFTAGPLGLCCGRGGAVAP